MEFQIGDEVQYTGGYSEGTQQYQSTLEKYRCVVEGYDRGMLRVRFFATNKCETRKEGYDFGIYQFNKNSFIKAGFSLTTQEKVLKKIKLLEQKFEERQKQKAKEKENANKIDPLYSIASVQRVQFQRLDISTWAGYTEAPAPRVEVRTSQW